MVQIDYWSDYACPYCYIGEARLKKAAEETLPKGGWTLMMHSFELDPSAPRRTETDTATRFAHKYGLTLDGAKARIEDISSLGRAEGLDFRYAMSTSLGCLGGVADQGQAKRRIISWILGVDVSVWMNLCGDLR